MFAIRVIKESVEQVKGTPGLAATLSDGADIIGEVGLDSLQMLRFMLELEERLSIQIDFDALEYSYLNSIQRLAEFLETMPQAFELGRVWNVENQQVVPARRGAGTAASAPRELEVIGAPRQPEHRDPRVRGPAELFPPGRRLQRQRRDHLPRPRLPLSRRDNLRA